MSDRPIQVLIVDDEDSLRESLARWLADEHGYQVETASDGSEALEQIRAKGCFDVVLLDYLLPRPYNGLELMKAIKEKCSDLSAFILFTGWGLDAQVGVEALRAGAYRYLSKPFDREELAILIQSIVEMRQTRQDLERTSREKAWLESLLEVSQSITSSLKLDEVLQLILDEMKSVVTYDSASIQLITDHGLQIIAYQGFLDPGQVLGYVFPLNDKHPNYYVWRSRQPFIVDDMQTAYRTRHVRGWLGVPLVYHDEAIGIITLDSRTPGFYDEDDASVATAFANQAAIAMENARLHHQTQVRASELHRLLEIGQQITRITDRPKGVLETIVRMACLVAGADCAVIYPYIADRRTYDKDNVSSFGLRHELTPSDKPREYGKSVTARIIKQSSGMCIVPDVTQDAERVAKGKSLQDSKFIVREEIKGFAGIRLDFGSEPVGVLFVNFRKPHSFTQDKLEIIRLLANQAAVAIWNARLYGRTSQRLEQKVAELQTVSEINQLISSTLDLDKVLPLILDKAVELFHVQNGVLQLVDDETGELVIQLRTDPHRIPTKQPRLKPGEGITGKAAQEKRSIIVHDVTQPPWRDIYREFWPDTRSELAVPLLIGDQCIGVLNLEHPEPGYFSEDEREILEGLAAQAAIAIENARLYDALKRRSQHLRALHEAGKAIAAGFAAELNHVLDRIAEQAVERITGIEGPKAVSAAVLRYDEAAHELRLESVYPPHMSSEFEAKLDGRIPLDKDEARAATTTGIVGRAFLEGKAQRVDDVSADPDYIEFDPRTKSELDVPLFDGDKVIGILSVESDQTGAFDEDDGVALQGLADLAVIAIKNAKQVERLKRTDAVALMGAWGADVAHDVNREVGAIRRAVFVLQRRSDLAPEVIKRLEDIDRSASRLALPELPEQAPESGRVLEFMDAPFLDGVIRAEVKDLQPVHPSVTLRLELNCEDVRVAIHERWLRRLLRHLIHNAAKTTPSEGETQLVIARTCVQGSIAEVQVEDAGPGVQGDVAPMLFQRPVPHEDGRLGRGLLLVRFLAEQHGGYAKLVWSRPGEGSCFAFGIPLAQPAVSSQRL